MSSSKLALAFCVLGLIFLIAVIVSVCCLLRARMSSNHSVRANGTSIFSSRWVVEALTFFAPFLTILFLPFSSGSQSRMGSKLFVPYGGSLPYGRVYWRVYWYNRHRRTAEGGDCMYSTYHEYSHWMKNKILRLIWFI